jgi:hypothetical protein
MAVNAPTGFAEAVVTQPTPDTHTGAPPDIAVMVIDAAAGWTEADGAIFRELWGKGPGTRDCKVKGMALLVANKADLAGEGGWGAPS